MVITLLSLMMEIGFAAESHTQNQTVVHAMQALDFIEYMQTEAKVRAYHLIEKIPLFPKLSNVK